MRPVYLSPQILMALERLYPKGLTMCRINFDMPALSDEELVLSAEELFLEIDRRVAEDAQS